MSWEEEGEKKNEGEEPGEGWRGQRYPLAGYAVESEPAAHRCDRLWGLTLHTLPGSLLFFPLFLSHPHLLTLLLRPCLTPAPHTRNTHALFFFFLPPNCNSCRSSSVSRRDKLKEDSHMALSHLSRGPHESQ